MRRIIGLTTATLLMSLVAACGGAHDPEAAALADDVGEVTDDPRVIVTDNDFEPAEIVVRVGSEVTWEWRGESAHDVVGPDFASDLQSDGTFAHTFDEPGTYTYVCNPHRGMAGTVHVVP